MLINQQNPNILPLRRKPHKRILNILCLRLGVYDEEVLLRVRRGGDVLLWRVISVLSSSLVDNGAWIKGNILRLPRGVIRLLSSVPS